MNQRLIVAVAAVCAGSGCIVVSDEDMVRAGDPLDAHFTLTWSVNDTRLGVEVDCRSVEADTVRIEARNMTTGQTLVDLFDCEARKGVTYAVTAGDYSVSVDLVACRGEPSCARPDVISELPTRTIHEVWSDGDVKLGHFIFLVD